MWTLSVIAAAVAAVGAGLAYHIPWLIASSLAIPALAFFLSERSRRIANNRHEQLSGGHATQEANQAALLGAVADLGEQVKQLEGQDKPDPGEVQEVRAQTVDLMNRLVDKLPLLKARIDQRDALKQEAAILAAGPLRAQLKDFIVELGGIVEKLAERGIHAGYRAKQLPHVFGDCVQVVSIILPSKKYWTVSTLETSSVHVTRHAPRTKDDFIGHDAQERFHIDFGNASTGRLSRWPLTDEPSLEMTTTSRGQYEVPLNRLATFLSEFATRAILEDAARSITDADLASVDPGATDAG